MNPEAEERRRVIEEARRAAQEESPNGAEKEPILRVASEVTPEKVDWLWPGRLARGKISMLEGDPGLGKSCLTLEVAARLSRGQLLPDGIPLAPMGTLFLSAEDGVADTMVPRLIAAGADLPRIIILEGVRLANGGERLATIPDDLDVLEVIMTTRSLGLVVIDPLSVFLGDDINENKNQEVRKALTPVKNALERIKVAGWLLRHWTKAQSASPIYRGAGSIGLGGAARIVMMVAEDPEIADLRILAGVKENLSIKPPSLAYRVVSNHDNPDVAQIAWSGQSTWRAADLQGGRDDEEGTKLSEAKAWLTDYLRGGVTVKAKQVQKDAKDDGHSERTLDKAKKALGVKSIKNAIDDHWGWWLPTAPLPDLHPYDQDALHPSRARDYTVAPLHPNQNTHNNNNIYVHPYSAPLEGCTAPLAETDQGGNNARVSGVQDDPPPF